MTCVTCPTVSVAATTRVSTLELRTNPKTMWRRWVGALPSVPQVNELLEAKFWREAVRGRPDTHIAAVRDIEECGAQLANRLLTFGTCPSLDELGAFDRAVVELTLGAGALRAAVHPCADRTANITCIAISPALLRARRRVRNAEPYNRSNAGAARGGGGARLGVAAPAREARSLHGAT
jgi:hypothetical protein